MNNFNHLIGTEICFGKGAIKGFGKKIAAVTDSVLLCYGGGSVKKNGVYDAVCSELNENGIRFCELSGIDPNPRIESVRKGVELIRENGLTGVLAIGGGSTIDCAKRCRRGGYAERERGNWSSLRHIRRFCRLFGAYAFRHGIGNGRFCRHHEFRNQRKAGLRGRAPGLFGARSHVYLYRSRPSDGCGQRGYPFAYFRVLFFQGKDGLYPGSLCRGADEDGDQVRSRRHAHAGRL